MEKKMTLSKMDRSDIQADFEEIQTQAFHDGAVMDPVLPTLFCFGASKKMLADVLAISQPSMSLYAQGRRPLPDKHRRVLYELLEIAVKAAENVKKRREHTMKLAKQGRILDIHHTFGLPKLKPEVRRELEENEEYSYKIFLDNLKRAKLLLKKWKLNLK